MNRKAFFDYVRQNLFGGVLNQSQVDGLNSILDYWDAGWSQNDPRWLAYALATTHHETGKTMQPIEEWGKGRGHAYGKRLKMSGVAYNDTENIFYGRGDVQLTWYENYEKAGKKLGQDFISHPELVMRPDNAAAIMFNGMAEGWFTGRKFADYFNANAEDWVNARRIINGLDKAELIAGYGQKYLAALNAEAA